VWPISLELWQQFVPLGPASISQSKLAIMYWNSAVRAASVGLSAEEGMRSTLICVSPLRAAMSSTSSRK